MQTSNSLSFDVHPYNKPFPRGYFWECFEVGTCNGLFFKTPTSINIYSICNKEANNGHLNDVFEWFDYFCKRDNKDFIIMDVFNRNFKKHLIEKREFESFESDHVIKKYRKEDSDFVNEAT